MATVPARLLAWRWGSVVEAARALGRRRAALQRAGPPACSASSSKPVRAAAAMARRTPESAEFWAEAGVIVLVLGPVEDLRAWGCGCACHRGAGCQPSCPLRGRRFPEAADEVQRCARRLREVLEGGVGEWPWLAARGLVGAFAAAAHTAAARVEEKFGFLLERP